MTWTVELDRRAAKELRNLDRDAQRRLLSFLRGRVATDQDPRRFGRPLSGERLGLWRHRVGALCLICQIEDARVVVLVLAVGHRKNIYR